MPVHDLGYRSWQGQRAAAYLRPLVIARGGVKLILKRRWLRLMVLVAWMPVIFPAFGIFAFEYSTTSPGLQSGIVDLVAGPLGRPDLVEAVVNDPDNARHEVWSALILAFFRYPQLFAMVTLIGLIAPLLVSYDLRTKAYLMYFSKPLSPAEYIVGKSAVIWFFLGAVATFPALLLYVMGILLSPDLSVIAETWDIPLRILLASVVLIVPTTTIAVFYSSLTAESRYATFAWFATWVMGSVAYYFLTELPFWMSGQGARHRGGPMDLAAYGVDVDRWRVLSPYHMLGKVQAWVFGQDPTAGSVLPSICVLVSVTVIGFWIVRRRIIARLSI